jgi:hypothetical protein
MKRIVMIIMTAALVVLPTMAQDWQSTSSMQGTSSAYSSQVTAVGATGVNDMATTTESSSPAKAPSGPRRTLIGGAEYGQSNESPIGDAWPLAVFAALFAIVITIKNLKKGAIMKKNTKITLFITALLMSNSMWGYDLPKGTYIFDLKTNFTTTTCKQIELFSESGHKSNLATFNTSQSCNTGITAESNSNVYVTSGYLEYVYFTLSTTISSVSSTGNFYHIRLADNTWAPNNAWAKFGSSISPVTGYTDVFLCRISENGSFEWITDASQLPPCSGLAGNPILQFQAADAHGSITTHTAGGEEVSSNTPVTSGSAVVLTATPAEHFRFRDWTNASGVVVSTDATYSFTITSSVNLTANFISDTDPSISGCSGCFKVAP